MTVASPTADNQDRDLQNTPKAPFRPLIGKTLTLFLPLFLLVLAAIGSVFWAEVRNYRHTIREGEKAGVVLGKRIILDNIAPVVADLRFLVKSVENSHLLERQDDAAIAMRNRVEQKLVAFSLAHRYYDQIRVIDAGGVEILRVNFNAGDPAAVGDDVLQVKKHRYYFKESIQLARGGIYVSPLDLNIERGAIETPLKPVIRLASPIIGENGTAAGIAVINYTMGPLLERFAKAVKGADSSLMLLNRDGYWLKGPTPADEWGFMYPDGRNKTFGNRFPRVWRRIKAQEFGQLTTGSGTFTFGTVFPLLDCPEWEACLNDSTLVNASNYAWIVVAHRPAKPFMAEVGPLVLKSVGTLMVAFCILMFLSFRLSMAHFQRRSVEDQLRRSKETLEKMVARRTAELQDSNQALRAEIDERTKIEKALRESQAKYRAMMEAMDDYAYICSPELKIEYMNPAMAAKFGADAVGKSCFEVIHGRNTSCSRCLQGRIQVGERVQGEDLRTIDGRFYHVSHNPIHHADGTISKMTIFRDVSDLKAAEEARLESERQFRRLVETMREGICLIDTDDRFTFVNRQFCAMLGYDTEAIVGRTFDEFLDAPNLRKLKRERDKRRQGNADPYELQWVKNDGEPVTTYISPSVLYDKDGTFRGSFAVVSDISDQKRSEKEKNHLEAQLRQAQKMEAIGVLAGGIAHDFNNILMPIMGYAELITGSLPRDHKVRGYVQPILDASQRAKELVSQILSFSRQSNDELKPTMIAPLVSEPLKLLKASIPSNIEITHRIATKEAMIMANPVHIHQVVMNLCTNAYHAMEQTGGRLSVSLSVTDVSDVADHEPSLAPGPYACLTVADTGPGIAPEFLTRIFDPYFTTKKQGKGTGLGLSVVHGIVTACRGISVSTADWGREPPSGPSSP